VNATALADRRPPWFGTALLRRGWIVLVCMITVAALAYGIAKVQSSTYSGVAVLAVSPSLGPTVPGGAQQAAQLAATYAQALPNDEQLRRVLVKRGGTSDGILTAFAPPGTSVVTVGYTAPKRWQAVKGGQAIVHALSGANPASSAVTTGSLQIVHHPTTPHLLRRGWHTHVVLLVSAGAGPAGGIDADRANKLATTYAGVIAYDDTLLTRVGHAIGETKDQVRGNLAVVNLPSSSLLAVTFKASTAAQALAGARTVALLVAGPHPLAATIVPSSIDLISAPTTAGSASSGGHTSLVVGALIGLALGLVLLIAWERSDPHVSVPKHLSVQTGAPATSMEHLSPQAASALLDRWAALTERRPARVAVLPADARAQGAAADAVRLLLAAGGERVEAEDRRGVPFSSNGSHANGDGALAAIADVALVQASPPGREGAGEAVALDCDLTVVVAPVGMRSAELRTVSEGLADFGILPVWYLLAPRRAAVTGPGTKADVVTR
jgi:hypothetical protein